MNRVGKQRPTEQEILESAASVIEAVLKLSVLERHKRDVISGMLWKITEARGKYKTRYRSRASLVESGATLQHEHVFTRKDLAERILATPERLREILSDAIGCVVTVEEHRRLSTVDHNLSVTSRLGTILESRDRRDRHGRRPHVKWAAA